MTREEAIKTLHELWRETNDSWYEEVYNMAIEALSAPQTDLINRGRADAIEAIQNAYCKPCKERGDDYHEVRCRACEYDNAIIQIDALPSAEAVHGEWIPCSERLPSKNQEVLLQCHHNMIVGYWMDGDFDGEKEWRALSGDGWENGCDFPTDVFEPLAWMPLPKPYSEESEI